MTPTEQAIAAIEQALRPIDNDGRSYGGPEGWGYTDDEINEWHLTFREAASPEALKLILSALKAAQEDAQLFAWIADRFLGADFDWNESGKQVLVIEWPGGPVYGCLRTTLDAARTQGA